MSVQFPEMALEAVNTDLEIAATYGTMAAARKAIDDLQYGGVDGSRIRLLGAAADAARAADARTNSAARDRPLVWRIFWRGVLWSLVGTPVGALLGLTLGLAGLEVINLWFTVLLWALFGHLLGGMWGAYAALSTGDAWEMTFQDVEGMPIVVAVRIEGDAARVERVLRANTPTAVGTAPRTRAADAT